MSINYCPKLLFSLKVTIESLLEQQVSDVWSIYGSLDRVCSALADVLYHGSRISANKDTGDIWPFIEEGLSLLPPHIRQCSSTYSSSVCDSERRLHNKTLRWLFYHVENHSIVGNLLVLLSDRHHVLKYYHPEAFLCQAKYAEALLICLKALAQYQISILADIDPSLYVLPSSSHGFIKSHRRCSSFPLTHQSQDIEMPIFSTKSAGGWGTNVVTGMGIVHGNIPREQQVSDSLHKKLSLRRSASLPSVLTPVEATNFRTRSSTINAKISPSVLKVDYSLSTKKHRSKCRKKRERRLETFMEDGGFSVRPAATGYFPRPSQGQSLASFLSTSPFTSADLDRENAHFRISEAIISAIEQVKCNRELKLLKPDSEDSDEGHPYQVERPSSGQSWQRPRAGTRDLDLSRQCPLRQPAGRENLEQRSQFQRRHPAETGESNHGHQYQRRHLRTRPRPSTSSSKWSDRADTTTSEQTPSPPSSESNVSEDDAGSDAEHLALSLLRQFEDKQLPRASELKWLVSAEDAPQELLPMPGSWSIAPDDTNSTPLRGTYEWAPPRPQLILTPHRPPVRKEAIARQGLRCAGCGCKVAPQFTRKFRYCDYLGRYFCTGCHTNKLAIIPGRVIADWDFNKYPVSNFSYSLLEQMARDPLIDLDSLNPKLFKKVKFLERTRTFRMQLKPLKDYLMACKFADHLKELLVKLPPDCLSDPGQFSIEELVRVRSGQLPTYLQALVKTGLTHVDTCDLCQARGFLCELCNCRAPIFPWNLGEVARCVECGACFHQKCFRISNCPRCVRLSARNKKKIN